MALPILIATVTAVMKRHSQRRQRKDLRGVDANCRSRSEVPAFVVVDSVCRTTRAEVNVANAPVASQGWMNIRKRCRIWIRVRPIPGARGRNHHSPAIIAPRHAPDSRRPSGQVPAINEKGLHFCKPLALLVARGFDTAPSRYERGTPTRLPPPIELYGPRRAIMSISTRAPRARPVTPMQVRAGRRPWRK